MAEVTTLARPYAEAAFRFADENNTLALWSRVLHTMATVAANPDVRTLIGDPKLTPERLYGLFMSPIGEDIPTAAQNFVKLLISNDRLTLLPGVRDLFEQLKNEREGTLEARIATAFALDDAQQAMLVSALEARYKRKVQIEVSVDQELIGGVRMVIGDEVIDSSVRGRLNNMAAALQS
ncbi:MAG: F0F1 ATP synthase subunit delta [Chromatiales bacterium]